MTTLICSQCYRSLNRKLCNRLLSIQEVSLFTLRHFRVSLHLQKKQGWFNQVIKTKPPFEHNKGESFQEPISQRKHRLIMAGAQQHLRHSQLPEQHFDYFLILDFEATCEENVQIHPQVNPNCTYRL